MNPIFGALRHRCRTAFALLSCLLLAACGGSGGGMDIGPAPAEGLRSGVAVDPYLVGAVLEEVTIQGAAVSPRNDSAPTDSLGRFTFPRALTDGNLIQLKVSQRGNHAGAPFTGMLRRLVVDDGSGSLTVSPLTTLMAAGMTAQEVVDAMAAAGLPGLTVADVTADPMAGVTGAVVVSDELLLPLQANMVANLHLQTAPAAPSAANAAVLDGGAVPLSQLVAAVKATLSAARFTELTTSIEIPVTLDDMIQAAARTHLTIANEVMTSGQVPPLVTIETELADMTRQFAQQHQGGGGTPPVDGATVFAQQCASCHNLGNGGLFDLTGDGALISARFTAGVAGHQGRTLGSAELAALIAHVNGQTGGGTGGGTTPPDGATLFSQNCAGCHNFGNGGLFDLGGDGALISGKFTAGTASHQNLTFTAAEITALANYANTQASGNGGGTGGGTTPPDGVALYGSECAGCHGALAASNVGSSTAVAIQAAIDGNLGSMGFLNSLSAEEVAAIATELAAIAPPTPPVVARTGQAVYQAVCAACHSVNGFDATGSPDLAAKGSLVAGKLPTHNGSSVLAEEIAGLASFLNSFQAPAPPVVARTGQAVYQAVCAACHSVNGFDATGSPDLAAKGSLVATKLLTHNGSSVLAEEVAGLAAFLNNYQAPATGPDYSNCTACHGQPPNGTSFPNGAGSHAVHTSLAGVTCASCHTGATHNGTIDLAFASTWNAKSGTATDNLDGTCSTVSCHGGIKTPVWGSGTIAVNTQCASCHTRGTTQYNSQNSGEHGRSAHTRLACTVCHDTAKLATGHFGNLSTTGFEQNPAATIKTAIGYANGSCGTPNQVGSCHGRESW